MVQQCHCRTSHARWESWRAGWRLKQRRIGAGRAFRGLPAVTAALNDVVRGRGRPGDGKAARNMWPRTGNRFPPRAADRTRRRHPRQAAFGARQRSRPGARQTNCAPHKDRQKHPWCRCGPHDQAVRRDATSTGNPAAATASSESVGPCSLIPEPASAESGVQERIRRSAARAAGPRSRTGTDGAGTATPPPVVHPRHPAHSDAVCGAVAHANPSGSVNGPASLSIVSR